MTQKLPTQRRWLCATIVAASEPVPDLPFTRGPLRRRRAAGEISALQSNTLPFTRFPPVRRATASIAAR